MCCGRSSKPTPRTPSFPSPSSGLGPQTAARAATWFEYRGSSALTIVSPHTGAVYRFPAPGARVAIDARDRAWVAFVPNLARVS
jgi:hypothetical protein